MSIRNSVPAWLAHAYQQHCVTRREPQPETISIEDALGRVTSEPVVARSSVPSWQVAACGGFALQSSDTCDAKGSQPTQLLVDKATRRPALRVDRPAVAPLPPRTAIRVCAYAPLPANADAVVRDHLAMSLHEIEHGSVLLRHPVSPGKNVIAKGSEFAGGEVLLEKGERITPERHAALIAAGVRELRVSKRPRVGVVVCSYDRRGPGVSREDWETADACGPYIRALMQRWGFEVAPVEYFALPPVAGLTPLERRNAEVACHENVREVAGRYDLIIGSGLLSTEPYGGMGLNRLNWFDAFGSGTDVEVAQVPGARFNFATSADRSPPRTERIAIIDDQGRYRGSYGVVHRDRAILVNLPGFLGTVALLMHVIVRRIVDQYEFVEMPGPYWELGVLACDVACNSELNRLLWARITWGEHGEPLLEPIEDQAPHRIGALLGAEVIVTIPALRGKLAAGSRVHFLRLDPTRQPAVPNCAIPAPIEVFDPPSTEPESMQPEMSVSQSWSCLDTCLVSAPDTVPGGLNPPATDEEIHALESELGINLPEDFRASLKIHNGQAPDGEFIDGETLLDAVGILNQWRKWRGLVNDGDFDGITSGPDDGIKDDWYNLKWIPFTYNGFGDHLCIDLDPEPDGTFGQIIRVWHDDDARQLIAPSFAAWLQETVGSLVEESSAG